MGIKKDRSCTRNIDRLTNMNTEIVVTKTAENITALGSMSNLTNTISIV